MEWQPIETAPKDGRLVLGANHDSDVRAANARLIAAAPDLLAELKRARTLVSLLTVRQVIEAGDDAISAAGLNPWCLNEGLAEGHEQIGCSRIDAAIAKAEGSDV